MRTEMEWQTASREWRGVHISAGLEIAEYSFMRSLKSGRETFMTGYNYLSSYNGVGLLPFLDYQIWVRANSLLVPKGSVLR